MTHGYIALVLHAHLPYVRHPEEEFYLEERWLYEAITETYIPLLQVLRGLHRDGVPCRLTLSLSPPLVTMLSDELLQRRYLRHLALLLELAEREVKRTAAMPEFHDTALEYERLLRAAKAFYLDYDGNIVKAFRDLQDEGVLQIITSAATHAFLPYVKTRGAWRAQIASAVAVHEAHFGSRPQGIWLPECGFAPGLDEVLREFGVNFFFIDTHALQAAQPEPVFGTFSPILTPAGAAAFARDADASRQVWSAAQGYPGDPEYREFYRDIGHDLDLETIRPYIHPAGIRVDTGFKYYRVTGAGADKAPYRFAAARKRAAQHAEHFLSRCRTAVDEAWQHMGRRPIQVATFDAELFGHWWYEGPVWIDQLFRQLQRSDGAVLPVTPPEYLSLYDDYQMCDLSFSSWGRGGYGEVWLQDDNDWIYPALHAGERLMSELADRYVEPEPLEERALRQAARELMLAQSSDFAFIMDAKTVVDYAVKRTQQHVNRFLRLHAMLTAGPIDEIWLSAVEELDRIFPAVDYRFYQTENRIVPWTSLSPVSDRYRVLFLSWEFPPMTVGGLSRHVYDLSRFLSRGDLEVHVLTPEVEGWPAHEVVEGVHVHRIPVIRPDGGEFVHWAFQMNLMMIDAGRKLLSEGLRVDLIHAHDWLVSYAARTLKNESGIPLVATIHATEHGRNGGIFTDLQRYIHHLEWKLTYEASQVILCSTYMKREVADLFSLPPEKLHVIANGVDPALLRTQNVRETRDAESQIVLFVGRLVREKGVQTLIAAAPMIVAACPDAQIAILGKGPEMEELKRQAAEIGGVECVRFYGFVSDEDRNAFLHQAAAAVFPSLYEPFGIVALEAMAAGTPVVVSDVGGLADVVRHEETGLKMVPDDPHSLAQQVIRLLQQPALARSYAEAATAELEFYDWNRIAKQTTEVYRTALSEGE